MYYEVKPGIDNAAPIMLWAHGWGQTSEAMAPLYTSQLWRGTQIRVDFPGFGKSSPPPVAWSSQDYALAIIELLRALAMPKPVVWVGHSFGCRVGLLVAAQAPDLVEKLCLLGCPGVPYQRSIRQRLRLLAIRWSVRLIKALPLPVACKNWLKNYYGSADYRNAGAMRATLVRVVNEDLTAQAKLVQQPVRLICGANDTETPVKQAETIHKLMHNAQLYVLEGHDHYSMLTTGQQQVINRLHKFLA